MQGYRGHFSWTSLIWTLTPVRETSVHTAGYCLFCKTHMRLSHNAPLSGHAALSLGATKSSQRLLSSGIKSTPSARHLAVLADPFVHCPPHTWTPGHQTPMDQSLTSDLQPLGPASFMGHSSHLRPRTRTSDWIHRCPADTAAPRGGRRAAVRLSGRRSASRCVMPTGVVSHQKNSPRNMTHAADCPPGGLSVRG